MSSEVAICNRALQKLGAERIISLTQDSRNARSCNSVYAVARDAELRAHPWSFAIRRVILAPDAEAPVFEYAYAFSIPADCLRILTPIDTSCGWAVESNKILTNIGTTLNLRYVSRVEEPNVFDSLFREVLSARIAVELCEEITQSNSKAQLASGAYEQAIKMAKKCNAFERTSEFPPEDSWITARL